jgi:hypothetical protein
MAVAVGAANMAMAAEVVMAGPTAAGAVVHIEVTVEALAAAAVPAMGTAAGTAIRSPADAAGVVGAAMAG